MSEFHLNQSEHVARSSCCKIDVQRCFEILPESVKTVPRQLKLNGKQVQGMPGHELNQSYRLQLRLQDMSEIHLNQSGHVACSSCCKINMRRFFGIRPDTVKTVPRQLKLSGKQVQGMPGHELNQS